MLAIATSLKKLRMRNELSQEQLGKKLGIARSFISGIEGCKRNITIETLDRLLIHLDSSYVDFVNYLESELAKNIGPVNGAKKVQQMYSHYWQDLLATNPWYSVTDQTGRLIRISGDLCHLLGYSQNELINQDHGKILSAHHSGDFMSEWKKILDGGQTFTAPIGLRTNGGEEVWFNTTMLVVTDPVSSQKFYVALRTPLKDSPGQRA